MGASHDWRRWFGWGLVSITCLALLLLAALMPTPRPADIMAYRRIASSLSWLPIERTLSGVAWLGAVAAVCAGILLDDRR